MNKLDLKKFKSLEFLENDEICSIYGQRIIDKFLSLAIIKLDKEGFVHYNNDFIHSNLKGKYYRIIGNNLEIMSSGSNINKDALDLQYLFSKILKDILGLALIEGSKSNNSFIYYYGYLYLKNIKKIYTIKQNNTKSYLKFNLFNIFYSVYEDNSYLSYKVLPFISIIPLHQNKSGVLSYAYKIKDNIDFNSYVDDRNISPIEKKKDANNKRIPIHIIVGPKEYKNKIVTIETNNNKYQISFDELYIINNLLVESLNTKYNQKLKDIYLYEKEITKLIDLSRIIKVNICSDCKIEKYKYFLTPFNRVSKTNRCILCNKKINNVILLRK